MKESKISKVYADHDVDKEQIRINAIGMASRSNGRTKRYALAVCASIMLTVAGVSGYAIAEEAREYSEAIEFFDEYSLSTDGLTRSEIKAIYKDITGKTYSYEKTVEIINNYHVEMYSTKLDKLDRDSLEAYWNERNANLNSSSNDTSKAADPEDKKIHYDIDYDWLPSENEQGYQYYKANIIKYEGETELWRYVIDFDFMIHDTVETERGFIVYGGKEVYSSSRGCACALMISNSGELMWEYYDSAAGSYYTASVLDGDELVLFGSGGTVAGDDEKSVCYELFTVLDIDGNIVRRRLNESDIFSYCDAAVKVGDVYLVKEHGHGNVPELITFTKKGERVNKYTYADGETTYIIRDIYSHGDKVYLSALKPNYESESLGKEFEKFMQKRYDERDDEGDADVTTYGYDFPYDMSADAELAEFFSEAYTAVLLVCNNNVDIKKAYSVENARGEKLGVDENGNLTWQVIRTDSAAFAPPQVSCCNVYVSGTEFSFVFSGEGKLVEKREIGSYSMSY